MNSLSLTPTTPSTTSYYPGCRKDTNCHCGICLASIDATRDLLRSAASISKLSPKKPTAQKRILALSDPKTPPSTSESNSSVVDPVTPMLATTAKYRRLFKQPIKKERSRILGYRVISFLSAWFLIWGLDAGFLAMVSKSNGPKFTAEMITKVGQESRVLGDDFKGRLGILERKIERILGGRVSNCGSEDSTWALYQESHLFFHWRCVIYKSFAEEVSIWGSPLRTSALLPTMFSPRSLTLLSGRITEWSDGKMVSTLRASNSSSWICGQWSSAILQLDPDTWVLEYERSVFFQGPGLIPATWQMLKLRFSKMVEKLKQEPWKLPLLHTFTGSPYYIKEGKITHPT
ncbi:uncharacterized protein [Typha angustifolia]|uniref:uncharacterized protein n=1 Tax=Typha angustifolia TaxID=59011 RepID=UPI003C2E4051